MKVKESLIVTFDESHPPTKSSPLVDDDVGEEEANKKNTKVVNNNNKEDESIEVEEIVNIMESKNHPLDQVIGNLNQRTLSLESIRILLAIACANDLKLYLMDVKRVFLNGSINEEVYVAQPLGFIDFQKPNSLYKLKKALYGLTQALKAWYDRLKAYLIKHEYSMVHQGDVKKFGLEDSKPTKTPMSTEIKLTKDDEADFIDSSKYQGMIDSLLYSTASRPNIYPKTTYLEAVKRIFRYIRGTSHLGLWYPKGTGIETIVYADSDQAGDYVDRKNTSGVCTFMGCCLTSWFAKKQTDLAISTTDAEYVFARKACQQALWVKQALIDYNICLNDVPIMCENKGAIDLSKNPVQHSRTKHIEIRHHFLCDNVQKGDISIEKVASEDNIADIFTKPLKREVFNYLRLGLGMMELIMDSDS
ncbi:retrovirus-related pol polyprotein from transposon TNT 1-94, partial [Tanacetum coccineum]